MPTETLSDQRDRLHSETEKVSTEINETYKIVEKWGGHRIALGPPPESRVRWIVSFLTRRRRRRASIDLITMLSWLIAGLRAARKRVSFFRLSFARFRIGWHSRIMIWHPRPWWVRLQIVLVTFIYVVVRTWRAVVVAIRLTGRWIQEHSTQLLITAMVAAALLIAYAAYAIALRLL